MGERPAVLSRGYGRRQAEDGVVVVRDSDGIRADLDRSGDEPLMLARQLPGVSVSRRAIATWRAASPSTTSARRCTSSTMDSSTCSSDRDIDLVIVRGR